VSWFTSLLPGKQPAPVRCPSSKCQNRVVPWNDIWYWCRENGPCPGVGKELPGKPENFKKHSMFRARGKFGERTECPLCGKCAHVLVCPCGEFLNRTVDDVKSIALVGTTGAGKTCFVVGLLHLMERELSARDRFQLSLILDEPLGQDHFEKLQRRLFVDNLFPDPTQRVISGASMIRARVGISRQDSTAKRSSLGARCQDSTAKRSFVSMVFPDIAGELIVDDHSAGQFDALSNAKATILIVDPESGPTYQEAFKGKNGASNAARYDKALDSLIKMKAGHSKDELLAIVLAKSDIDCIYNPDVMPDPMTRKPFGRHGDGEFRIELADGISREVERYLTNNQRVPRGAAMAKLPGLGMANLVHKAKDNFREVRFFAATALGREHERILEKDADGEEVLKVYNVRPERVEEPLLWILHCWGLL
jgi:hypothetical protein